MIFKILLIKLLVKHVIFIISIVVQMYHHLYSAKLQTEEEEERKTVQKLDLKNKKWYLRFTIYAGVAASPILILAKLPHVLQIAVRTGLRHVPRRQLRRARITARPHFRVKIYLHRTQIHLRPQLQLSDIALRPQNLLKTKFY